MRGDVLRQAICLTLPTACITFCLVPIWQVPTRSPRSSIAKRSLRSSSGEKNSASTLSVARRFDKSVVRIGTAHMLRTTSADVIDLSLPRPVLAIFITYELCFPILGIALTQLKSPLTPPESGVVSTLVDARKASLGRLLFQRAVLAAHLAHGRDNCGPAYLWS